MIVPISRSLLAEMVATLAMSSLRDASIGLGLLLEVLDDRVDRLADAAGDGHRVGAGRQGPVAFLEDGLGEHGRGRRAVAGDVGRLAGGFLHELGADVLVLVGELDLLGDRSRRPSSPVGAPQPLSMTALRPRGPRVLFTARDSLLTPSNRLLRASASKANIFAAMPRLLVQLA
jgi:hypothetical protein